MSKKIELTTQAKEQIEKIVGDDDKKNILEYL